ncbi:hypothetical protein, partial [Bordetella petrii]|uniref:hypothetical protein n=1 Tax=Bordetella petrii TaxID=94624 RepID=UPI001E63BC20
MSSSPGLTPDPAAASDPSSRAHARWLAALERQKIVAEHDELQAKINEYNAILASPERQRRII